jgi:hypothetical protein
MFHACDVHAEYLGESGSASDAQRNGLFEDPATPMPNYTETTRLDVALRGCKTEELWREACMEETAKVQTAVDAMNDILDELRYGMAELAGSES